ncbi:MAG: NAD(P)-dependent glycerol-3-phosphate dehydrogenase [Chloroflexota bacterium]|nr:NAD(P)-dependent glycerol-3-phosphate dehydrogenase [Chloroflexota bacterium]
MPAGTDEILVVGTGSWGTALAVMLARYKPVSLLCRDEEEFLRLQQDRANRRFLDGVPFPQDLRLGYDAEAACAQASIVILLVPSSRIRDNARLLARHLSTKHVVLSGAKGLEHGSLLRMTQVLEQELSSAGVSVGALSGPNLAREIAAGKRATAVVASENADALTIALPALNTPQFRVYANSDVTGVELGGALKNVIAIGAGAVDGLEAGENGKAAFVTRGLAEIARLGVAAGAHPLTFAGLTGLGDLLATVSSPNSRNRRVGEELARGRTLQEVRASLAPQVAEGIETTRVARELATRHGVEMPITEQTYQVLFEGKSVADAVEHLMFRDPRHEFDA